MPHSHVQSRQSNVRTAQQFDHEDRKEAEIALYEATAYLQKQLKLSGAAIARILRLPTSTVNNWLQAKRIPIGSSDRICSDAESVIHLVAIHKNLEAMLDTPEAQREWLNTMRPDLNFVPLKKIAESFQSLLSVRQYLDFVRGRGA